uniref:Reverse transcriptase domain-containing protein n=1 Tax=Anopheles atroparvus TaxID=41427 RepID=A0AAG5DGZ9_ANOAO
MPIQRILQSWFINRELLYETDGGVVSRRLTAGVPQGSILGPTLWNIMYDSVLATALPDNAEAVAFADDLVLLVPGRTPAEASGLARRAVDAVNNWMVAHQLQIAPAKTEIVMVSNKKKDYKNIPVFVNGTRLTSSADIRYLGVRIHDRLSWRPHVEFIANKATKVAYALVRLMKNHSGPKCAKRRLLASVVDSVLRYAAPVWHDAVETRTCRGPLIRAQKTCALRVAFAFRTVAYKTAVAIAGIVPICRLVREDARCYQRLQTEDATANREQIRNAERQATLSMWQEEWDRDAADETASRYRVWTHRVLPDLVSWQTREHGEVNFHLCQVLSGHGFFRDYLHCMQFTSSPDCKQCPGVPETAEHAVFVCPRFDAVRHQWRNKIVPSDDLGATRHISSKQ